MRNVVRSDIEVYFVAKYIIKLVSQGVEVTEICDYYKIFVS